MIPAEIKTVRQFAKFMLASPLLLMLSKADASRIRRFGDVAVEAVVFREGPWQVEFITLLPGAEVVRHRHNHVDSCDVCVGIDGTGVCIIGGRQVASAPRAGCHPLANLVHIPKGAWHEGAAGAKGAVCISFQKWDTDASMFISEDWEI